MNKPTTTWQLVPAAPTKDWTNAFAARGPRIGTFDKTIRDVLESAPALGIDVVQELQGVRAALAFLPSSDAAVAGLDRIIGALTGEQSKAPATVVPLSAASCDQEVFERGTSVGIFDMAKALAQRVCEQMTAATGHRVDWHYIGGRVHIKVLPAAKPQPEAQSHGSALRDSVMEAIAGALGEAYDCTRAWSAWSHGTMGPDDFARVAEDSDRLADLADAAIAAMGPAPAADYAPGTVSLVTRQGPGQQLFTYTAQPCDNVIAWRIGEACTKASQAPAGDYIDRGLVLLKALQAKGYGIAAVAARSAQPGPQTEAPHDDQWTPEQLAAIQSQGPAEPFEIPLVPITYPVPDEIADPCPQCVSGAVCKKPTCGRLIAQTSGQANVTLPPTPRDAAYAVRRIRSCDDEAAAQVALEHFANGHACAAILAYRQQRAGGVSPTLLASTHKGMRVDYRGLLHQARADLGRNSALAEMLRQLQVHLRELGQRWYTADTAVVDELLQLYCIESEARAALLARAGENNG